MWHSRPRRLRSPSPPPAPPSPPPRPPAGHGYGYGYSHANSHANDHGRGHAYGHVHGPGRDRPADGRAGRRVKRRRLDAASRAADGTVAAHRYGRYGQVLPGKLDMEIVSCDGGLYSEGASYAAENILADDESVYCTKGNRCNIILRHYGGTPFSLEELVIRAPATNFSSP